MNQKIAVRVQKYVLDQLDEKQKYYNFRNRSELIREILIWYINKRDISRAVEFLDELKMFRQEFARIGGNLNQIARSYNMSEQINRNKLEKVHEELRQEFKSLVKDLRLINGKF